MSQTFVYKTKPIARRVVFAVLLAMSFHQQTKAAQNCPTGGTISETQRGSLKKLPLDLRNILKAVRRQRQTSCRIPQAVLSQTGVVDPLFASFTPPPAITFDQEQMVPDEVVALITGDGRNIASIARTNRLTVRSSRRSSLLGGFIVRFGIQDGRSVASLTASLQTNSAVTAPGPNHIYQLQASRQRSSTYEEARFAPQKIGMPANGHKLSGKDILIGVIDTAIDPNHPDLQGAVMESYDALPDQPVSNMQHGTAVAGLIAGRSMIRGVAPRAKLLVARAFDDNRNKSKISKASATSHHLLDALEWTVEKGAHIINMSFTGPRNELMSRALAAAAKKNILLIAAAGNNGPNAPAAYPAAEPSVLAVTATDIDDRIYAHANNGRYVFVAAPGVDVLAAAPDKGIDMVSGTSFAAPFLSGLAALLLEQNSNMTPQQIARQIAKTSQDLGQPGRDQVFGVGLANLNKALAE